MPDIPQEIHDEILRSYLLDSNDLRACSLVCRSWLSVTRSRLFSTIKLLSGQAVRDFTDVISHAAAMHSNITHYMQEVTLGNLRLNLDDRPRNAGASSLAVHRLLSLLPSIRTLTLENIGWSQSTDPDLPAYFSDIPIASLHFAQSRLRSPGDLLRLAASLPSLCALSLSFMRWEAFDLDEAYLAAAARHTGRAARLQSLRVHKCFNARGLLRGLLAAPFETRLARLDWTLFDMWGEASSDDLYQHEVDEASQLSALLQASNTTLTALRLSTYWEDAFLKAVTVAQDTPVKTFAINVFRPADCLPYDTFCDSLPLFLKNNARALTCMHHLELRLGIFDRYAMCWGMDWGDVDLAFAVLRDVSPSLKVTLRLTFVSHDGNTDPDPEDIASLAEIVGDLTQEFHEYLLPSSLAAGLPVQLIVRLFQPGQTEADAEEQSLWL